MELLGALGSNSAIAAALAGYQVRVGGGTRGCRDRLVPLLPHAAACPCCMSTSAAAVQCVHDPMQHAAPPSAPSLACLPGAHQCTPLCAHDQTPGLPAQHPAPSHAPQALTGDWHNVLADLQSIEDLGRAEARDAAGRWLRPDNVFKGYVLPA